MLWTPVLEEPVTPSGDFAGRGAETSALQGWLCHPFSSEALLLGRQVGQPSLCFQQKHWNHLLSIWLN